MLLTLCLMLPICALGSQNALAATKWVSAWTTGIVNGGVNISGMNLQDIIPSRSTVRTELTVMTGGESLRFRFSNQYGSAPIRISEAAVAKTDTSAAARIVEDTITAIRFHGEDYVDIPAGEAVWSDAVRFSVEAFEKISVSLFFENLTYITTTGLSNGKSFLSPGSILLGTTSKVSSPSLSGATEMNIGSGSITYHTIPFLCGIDARTSDPDACAAVFIGDSTLVNDTHYNYALKASAAGAKNISVVNQAIIGNKLLSNGTGLIGKLYGDAMLDRFDRDVLGVSGVKYCFVKIGLNDILHQYTKSMQADTPKHSAQDIINGYKKLIEKAHSNGINIYFFSKTPWNGYERSFLGQTGDLTWNAEAQAMCDELDKWLKSENGSDGFIDCSELASPADKTRLCPSFTTNGAHLTSLGSIALADLIPLEYVGLKSKGAKTVAEIMRVDPYVEKRKIEYDMKHKPAEPTTVTPEEPATAAPEVPTTAAPLVPDVPTTNAPATQTVPYVPTTSTTVPFVTNPYVPSTEVYTKETPTNVHDYTINYSDASEINYVVSDEDIDVIGTDAPIGFILLLFSSIVASAAIVILTIGKKKEF